MKLKKTNAALGLLSILVLLSHAGYQVVAYIFFLYNPLVTMTLAWMACVLVLIHAAMGMSLSMITGDGGSLMSYPRDNRRTILQRASAIGIIILLPLHVVSFEMLKTGTAGLVAAEIITFAFYSLVFTHIATGLTNAFVTLGWLEDIDKKKKIDRVVWIICAILCAVTVLVIGIADVAISSMPSQ